MSRAMKRKELYLGGKSTEQDSFYSVVFSHV